MDYNVGVNTEEKGLFDDFQENEYLPLANKWRRLANYLLDFIFAVKFAAIILVAILVVVVLVASDTAYEHFADTWATPLAYVGFYLYYAVFEGANNGRTIAKLITRTQAVREDAGKLTWQDALLRSLCRFVPFEVISGLLGDAPWHDSWTKTKVILRNKK